MHRCFQRLQRWPSSNLMATSISSSQMSHGAPHEFWLNDLSLPLIGSDLLILWPKHTRMPLAIKTATVVPVLAGTRARWKWGASTRAALVLSRTKMAAYRISQPAAMAAPKRSSKPNTSAAWKVRCESPTEALSSKVDARKALAIVIAHPFQFLNVAMAIVRSSQPQQTVPISRTATRRDDTNIL